MGQVVSISSDGSVNLAGSGGRGVPAHQAVVLARANDSGAEAKGWRVRAANLRALRAKTDTVPSARKLVVLADYRVQRQPQRS
jgi:hypothetical protein